GGELECEGVVTRKGIKLVVDVVMIKRGMEEESSLGQVLVFDKWQ
ncbi:5596_t:CDS:2, partial [Acaulospora morrowiae]